LSHEGPGEARDEAFGFDDESWMGRLRAASTTFAQGTLGSLGDFELLGQIGQGGQATVYKARQPGTGRFVAIKRVKLAGLDDRALARFQREIEVAATLRHHGIVTVHELIDDGRGLVMEWIDGIPLDRWADEIRGQHEGLRTIAACVKRACEAVAHAHGQGVIHRDLKPTNILVELPREGPMSPSPQPKVLDFGLARDLTKHEATFTIQGAFAGTPVYAAPEQIDEGLHAADVRADVYAMGVVLYRALTGREPFESATLAGLFDLIRRGKADSPRTLNPQIDDELESIVLMAMRPDRTMRYATMADLADDLGRWLDRKAVRAHPLSTLYIARTFVRRHRLLVGLSAASITLITAGGIAAAVLAYRLNLQRVELQQMVLQRNEALEAVTQRKAQTDRELVASSVLNSMLGSLISGMAGESDAAKAVVVGALRKKGEQLLAPKVSFAKGILPRMQLAIAATLLNLDEHDLAEKLAKRSIELGKQQEVGEYNLSHAYQLIGTVAFGQQRFAETIEALEHARALARARESVKTNELGLSDSLLIESLVKVDRRDDAQRIVNQLQAPAGAAAMIRDAAAAEVGTLCDRLGLNPPAWAKPTK
jgi:tRNA A-37 threonylcarbamoyl transferase component Bud32/tetratricopeptide (TPR) repeat protein